MDLTDFPELLTKASDSGSPIIIVGIIISNILTALVTRAKSKDTTNSDIMKETMNRQSEIDQQQKELVAQLRNEINRIGEEMNAVKEEVREQKADNIELYSVNKDLSMEISELKLELREKDFTIESLKRESS